MPVVETTHSTKVRYAEAMNAVLEEIERFKQELPNLLKELRGEQSTTQDCRSDRTMCSGI
jgi:hypothetical protein